MLGGCKRLVELIPLFGDSLFYEAWFIAGAGDETNAAFAQAPNAFSRNGGDTFEIFKPKECANDLMSAGYAST